MYENSEIEIELFGNVDHVPELRSLSCAFIGHSFIGRLNYWLESEANCFENRTFDLDRLAKVDFYTHTYMATFNLNQLRSKEYDIVIIHFGENDLDSYGVDAEILVEMYCAFLRNLREILPHAAIICTQLLYRNKPRRWTKESFRTCVKEANGLLKARIAQMPNTTQWAFRELWRKKGLLDSHDGVHLSPLGLGCYARSLRGALLNAFVGL